jgi:exonuclease VII small subunit|tara:strand:+ start:22 stop:198 length:177 start_codon:yes stop_codon:yes gene_type:complete
MTKNEMLELFKSFSEGTQKGLYKIVDKLEQRIATLEKVLESHAKCIGEIREDKNDNIN